MELRHLQQVFEICRSGGFSGAARKLEISQPTLSKSIARLEARLGLQLFERTGGVARPTPYGAFVAERAEALLQGVANLGRDLDLLARGDENSVRIAVGPGTRTRPLPQLLRLLARRHPQLRIETVLEPGPAVPEALRDGRADIGFVYSELARAYPDLICKKLFEDRVVVAARAGHPALALEGATPAQLLAYPFARTRFAHSLDRWAAAETREQAANLRAFVSDDFGLIVQRALDTDTLAVGTRFQFAAYIAAERMEVVSSTLDWPYVCWMIATQQGWKSPMIRAIAELAKTAAKLADQMADEAASAPASPSPAVPAAT